MFWFIIPDSMKGSYRHLKNYVLRPTLEKPSQITLQQTLTKKSLTSMIARIMMQIAAKAGCKLWLPKVPSAVVKAGVVLIGVEEVTRQ